MPVSGLKIKFGLDSAQQQIAIDTLRSASIPVIQIADGLCAKGARGEIEKALADKIPKDSLFDLSPEECARPDVAAFLGA